MEEEEDENPELYTSGSEDGELVRREDVPNVPAGVKIKTERTSDSEQVGQQPPEIKLEQPDAPGGRSQTRTPGPVDTETQALPPAAGEPEDTSQPDKQQQQPTAASGVTEEQGGRVDNQSQEEQTDKPTDSQSNTETSAALTAELAGARGEEEDDEEDDEDDDDEEDDDEEGEGEGEMDQMELLELEMRARAIKAMLGSHGQPGDTTEKNTGIQE